MIKLEGKESSALAVKDRGRCYDSRGQPGTQRGQQFCCSRFSMTGPQTVMSTLTKFFDSENNNLSLQIYILDLRMLEE
jgi:hypothetical protein